MSAVDPPPISASTATTAAAALAALPPSPLDSGSPFRMLSADAASFAELREQRQRGDARRVARRVAREPAVVAVDALDDDAVRVAREEPRRDFVARMVEGEAKDVEAAADIRHGGRSKRGRGDHWV